MQQVRSPRHQLESLGAKEVGQAERFTDTLRCKDFTPWPQNKNLMVFHDLFLKQALFMKVKVS